VAALRDGGLGVYSFGCTGTSLNTKPQCSWHFHGQNRMHDGSLALLLPSGG
jgi:hypothetical protein